MCFDSDLASMVYLAEDPGLVWTSGLDSDAVVTSAQEKNVLIL